MKLVSLSHLAAPRRLGLLAPAIVLLGAGLAVAPTTGQSPAPGAQTAAPPAARAGRGATGAASRQQLYAGATPRARGHHQGHPDQQSRAPDGGANGAGSQDGEDPERAHGGGDQGQLGGNFPADDVARGRQQQ